MKFFYKMLIKPVKLKVVYYWTDTQRFVNYLGSAFLLFVLEERNAFTHWQANLCLRQKQAFLCLEQLDRIQTKPISP